MHDIDAATAREDRRRLTDYSSVSEEIEGLVSERVSLGATGVGLCLLAVGVAAVLLDHAPAGGVLIYAASAIITAPRALASYRYLAPLDLRSAWWLLRTDHNATLIVVSSVLPLCLPVAALGVVTAIEYGEPLLGVIAAPAYALALPGTYLVYVHRRDLFGGFYAAVRFLRRRR